MSLTQIEKDLQRYAQDKLLAYVKDVAQSFDIAGLRRDSLPCIGAVLLKAAAHIAIVCAGSKEDFLRWAGDCYDATVEHK